MPTVSRKEAKDFIPKRGQIFSVKFIKKDGTIRHMNCRTGVKKYLKGGKLAFNPDDYNLVSVCDMKEKKYKFISLTTMLELRVGGKTINFR